MERQEIERGRKDEIHELPYTEMVKSGTIRLVSGLNKGQSLITQDLMKWTQLDKSLSK